LFLKDQRQLLLQVVHVRFFRLKSFDGGRDGLVLDFQPHANISQKLLLNRDVPFQLADDQLDFRNDRVPLIGFLTNGQNKQEQHLAKTAAYAVEERQAEHIEIPPVILRLHRQVGPRRLATKRNKHQPNQSRRAVNFKNVSRREGCLSTRKTVQLAVQTSGRLPTTINRGDKYVARTQPGRRNINFQVRFFSISTRSNDRFRRPQSVGDTIDDNVGWIPGPIPGVPVDAERRPQAPTRFRILRGKHN
jgi:hypothetical protein